MSLALPPLPLREKENAVRPPLMTFASVTPPRRVVRICGQPPILLWTGFWHCDVAFPCARLLLLLLLLLVATVNAVVHLLLQLHTFALGLTGWGFR